MRLFSIVFLYMLVTISPINGQNLISNPGFEVWDTSSTGQDSMPRFWHFFTRSVLCSGYVAKTNGYQGFGAKLVVIGDTSGYDASFYHYINRIDTLPFADDTFLVYMRVRENSAKISGRFWAYWLNSSGNIVGSAVSSSYTVNSEDWQEVYVKTLRPSDGVTFKFEFRIYKYSSDEDSIIVDDAYFGPTIKDGEALSVIKKSFLLVKNKPDTLYLKYRNNGPSFINTVRIKYLHKVNNLTGSVMMVDTVNVGAIDSIAIPIVYNFVGVDTLVAWLEVPGDTIWSNDTIYIPIEIWPDSTVAASNFNSPEDFPPVGWSTEILQDTFNWGWYDTCVVVNWGGRYLAAPVFEGRGVAGYPSHEAARGSSARLITNPFNIGSARKRVVLNFYMLRSKFLYFDYLSEDSLMVEYLIDGDYVPVTVVYRVDTTLVDSSASWQRYTVVIGDFPADTTISVSFRAFGEGGLNMFIDSVLIFTTAPGPEFDFNLNSDIGKYQNSDNYWVRIRPYGSPYPIEACSLYYRILNKSFTAVPMDSTDEETGYFYFTIPNDDPALDKNVEFYFEFFEGLPWMYANRYPSTGTISYTILPVADKIPTSFSFGLLNSRITQGNFDFTYAVPVRSNVEICVYSVTGQRVATLVSGIKDPGYYTVKWDGRSNSGSRLPSGVYFVKMVTPEKSFTQRVLIGR
ncbi:MAG: FlgD immunoglobulin-like domain containing protein [candidate division WOR-3 bacterium]